MRARAGIAALSLLLLGCLPDEPQLGGRADSQPEIVAAGETFTCTPARVWDGDGPLWCQEGPRIRLSGIAAREVERSAEGAIVDAGCRDGHPCPLVDGVMARDALVRLLGQATGQASTGHVLVEGAALSCVSEGSGKGTRTAARCRSPRVGDLSCAMIENGSALRWDNYWSGPDCR